MEQIKLPITISTGRLTARGLDISYPIVSHLHNIDFERTINSTILDMVYRMIAEQGYYEDPNTQITGTYEIKNNQRGVLSLDIIVYSYSGGAHGLTAVHSITLDVNKAKFYQLEDLFKPGVDYLKILSDLAQEQIKERDIPLLAEYKGIKADQDFYVADKTLVIYFQLYELTAYAYGLPHFPISIYDIQDIINEDGPLGELIY